MSSTIDSNPQAEPAFAGKWLVLIAQLPAKPDYLRVKLRRRIQRVGALSLRGAVYVLPNRADTLEDLVWLRGELIGDGGDAIICSARTVVGITDAELEARFRELRAGDYRDIAAAARAIESSGDSEDAARELSRLRRRLDAVARLDFFGSPVQAEARRAVDEVANRRATKPAATEASLDGRTWMTRSDVFVDRIASAWLIRRFIDRHAKFEFTAAASQSPRPGLIRFDMYEAEYTHEGDRCTFETLLERFELDDPALRAIAEIVHDIDCKDDKFARPEAAGVELVLRGLVSAESDDLRRLERGVEIFDGFMAQLGGAGATSP